MSRRIACDIHTHTIYSRHAYSTIGENVAAAQAKGMELLGSSDHFSRMLFPGEDIRNYQYFLNQRAWPRVWGDVVVLRAAEVDIVSREGRLFGQGVPCPENIVGRPYRDERSLLERVTADLDYLIASVHDAGVAADATIAQASEMYMAALDNPRVLVLGHTGRSGVPFDIDAVLEHARATHKLIEINEHSLEGDPRARHQQICRSIACRCAELGVGIVVSSDAHLSCAIGEFDRVERMLDEIHFPPELIANRTAASLLDALHAAGVCDLRELACRE